MSSRAEVGISESNAERNAGTSTSKEKEAEEDIKNLNPFVDFTCSSCGLDEKCLFGELQASDGFYPSPVFFMRDPFVPPVKVRGRRPLLSDFLVIGSTCHLCERAVCISKCCSVYFGGHFCARCIVKDRRRFPAEVLEIISKAQEAEKSATKS